MKGISIIFDKEGATIDVDNYKVAEDLLLQNLGVVVTTSVGSDGVISDKGTNLRSRLGSGRFYDIVSSQHECNFAVVDASTTIHNYQPDHAEPQDRVSKAKMEIATINNNLITASLSVVSKNDVTVGEVINT